MNNKENESGNENPQNDSVQTSENPSDSSINETQQDQQDHSLEDKIKELETKLAEEKDRYLRLFSEFDNAKKRNARERIELLKSAGEDFFKSVLPVLDDFERAVNANEKTEDVTALREGFQLIQNKMKNLLQGKGLEEMKCVGEAFDSDSMEALANIPAPSEDLKSKVVEVIEKGYLLNGKVIRFAKVIVGS